MTYSENNILRNEWIQYKLKNGTNLPKGYTNNQYLGTKNEEVSREIRRSHIVRVLKVFYNQLKNNPELYSGNNYGLEKFHHHIIDKLVCKFRYQDIPANTIQFKDVKIQHWYNELLDLEGRRSPTDKVSMDTSSLVNWTNNFEACLRTYNQRIWNLAELMFKFHQIIEETKSSALPLLYGKEMGGIRSWLGQEFLRNFPFKDIIFNSTANKQSAVMEHWTPISFFRDIPMMKRTESFGVESWFEVLRYQFRIVKVCKEEDKRLSSSKLNGSKYTMKVVRPINGYELNGIQISEYDLWTRIYEKHLR